jgi:hypothetical protein
MYFSRAVELSTHYPASAAGLGDGVSRGLRFLALAAAQISRTIRIFLRGTRIAGLDRVLVNVFHVTQVAGPVGNPNVRKSFLPDLPLEPELLLRAIGEVPFDHLHGLLDRPTSADRQQDMKVIAHDHEFMDFKFPLVV